MTGQAGLSPTNEPSLRVRHDCLARISCHSRLQPSFRSIVRIVGRTTDPDHTAPYGADRFTDGFLAVNCQATIVCPSGTDPVAHKTPLVFPLLAARPRMRKSIVNLRRRLRNVAAFLAGEDPGDF
jgi:hypothetical protein